MTAATSTAPLPPPNPAALREQFVGNRVPTNENYRTHYGRALDLTRIDYSIRSANHGYMRPMTDLGRESCSLDGHLSALLQKRLNRVAALDWEVVAARGEGVDDDRAEELATFVRNQVEQIGNFRERIMDLAWGTFDGRAALELGWRADGRRMRVDDLYWIHPRRLSFGPNRDLRVVDASADMGGFSPQLGFPLETVPYKFVRYLPRLFGDYQEREGLGPRCLYWSFFCRFGTRERLALLELFGKPWRIVMPKENQVHNDAQLDSAFEVISALGAQSTARLPPGMDLMIAQPQRGAGQVHDEAIDHAMKVLSKLVLGSTGTTDAVSTGLGSSIGDAHLSEEDLIIASDARRLGEAIETGLTDAIVAVNYGPTWVRHAPRFVLRTDPPLDRQQEADRIGKALEVGLDIALEEAREKLGFREVKPGEPFIRRVQRPAGLGMVAPAPAPEIVYPIGEAPAPGEIPDQPLVGLNLPPGGSESPPTDGNPGEPPPLPPGPSGAPPAPALPAGDAPAEVLADEGPDETVAALADKMTELGIDRCEHGRSNRCPLCGIERVRDCERGPDGEIEWKVQWRPIRRPRVAPPPAPGLPELAARGETRAPVTATTGAERRGLSFAGYRDVEQCVAALQRDGHDEDEAIELCEALRSELETTRDRAAHACAVHSHGDLVCLAVQPSTVFGSPETLIDRGVEETASATAALAQAMVEAVSGKISARTIRNAIDSAAKRFSDRKIAAPVERELLQGLMLGALDTSFEASRDEQIDLPSFSALHDPALFTEAQRALADPFRDTSFAARPLKEAIARFLKRNVVTRDVFDSMEAAAQRRAFTVAGAANREMVRTIKRELIRQVALGADLRDFGKQAVARFESAGWMPANSSHVETVFRTNVLNAYSGGRVRQMSQPEVLEVRPYWQILTVNDGPPRQRPSHQKVHGVVLKASDPFWQRATPPFGYNCRCRLRSLSVLRGAAQGKLMEGSSIAGLPDAGFTSGTGTLL